MKLAYSVLFLWIFAMAVSAQALVHPTNKTMIIKRLQELKAKQLEQLEKIDRQTKKRIAESQRISLKSIQTATSVDADRMANEIAMFGQALDQLNESRQETLARRDVIDQLISNVATKWDGNSSLRELLQTSSLDMAVIESAADRQDNGADTTKFFSFLSIVLREGFEGRAERPEDVVGFIDDYMEFASVLSPKLPTEFLKDRSYSNGIRAMGAKTASKVAAGDYADAMLKKIEASTHEAITSKTKMSQNSIPMVI
jgi:hypothetical protein